MSQGYTLSCFLLDTNWKLPTDIHKKDYPPWPNCLCPGDAGMVKKNKSINVIKQINGLKDKNHTLTD